MAIDITQEPAVAGVRRQWSVADYYAMAAAGILTEADRVELIEGEVVRMSPIGSRHAACVDRLTGLLAGVVAGVAQIRVQNPVRLSEHSEPQPDLSLLRPRPDYYATAHPAPADILLVVEVADTSIGFDRSAKVPLYARAGIAEVWLVDVTGDRVTQYAMPAAGAYTVVRDLARGDELISASLPGLTLAVTGILGEQQH